MVTKKPKAKPKPKPKTNKKTAAIAAPPLALAAPAAPATAEAALMAFSTPASAADVKNEVILRCVVSVFDAEGLTHIQSQQDRIVWSSIDDPVIVALGDGITVCITGKGFGCSQLAPPFQNLKNMGQVTTVANLVSGIATLVTP